MPFILFYVAPHKHPGLQVASLFCTLNLTQLHGPGPHPKLLKLFLGSSGNSPSSAKPPSIPSLFCRRTLRTGTLPPRPRPSLVAATPPLTGLTHWTCLLPHYLHLQISGHQVRSPIVLVAMIYQLQDIEGYSSGLTVTLQPFSCLSDFNIPTNDWPKALVS